MLTAWVSHDDDTDVLCVKDNHPGRLDPILFAELDPTGKLIATSSNEITLGKNNHGPIEARHCWAYYISSLPTDAARITHAVKSIGRWRAGCIDAWTFSS